MDGIVMVISIFRVKLFDWLNEFFYWPQLMPKLTGLNL